MVPYTEPYPSPGNKRGKAGMLCHPKLPFILKVPLEERDKGTSGLTTTSPTTRAKVGARMMGLGMRIKVVGDQERDSWCQSCPGSPHPVGKWACRAAMCLQIRASPARKS